MFVTVLFIIQGPRIDKKIMKFQMLEGGADQSKERDLRAAER